MAPAHLEPALCHQRSHCSATPTATRREQPPLAAPRESPRSSSQTPDKQNPGPDGLRGESYQTTGEELAPILLKVFPKTAEEGTLLNSFYEATIILITKPAKGITKKENDRLISLMNTDAKTPNKVLANQLKQYIKKITQHDRVGFIPGMQVFFNIQNSVINKLKHKNHMININRWRKKF